MLKGRSVQRRRGRCRSRSTSKGPWCLGDIADVISAECRFQRKVAGNDRVKVAGAMLFYRIIHSECLTTDFADELMGDRRKEVASHALLKTMSGTLHGRPGARCSSHGEITALRGRIALPEQNLEQDVPRTDRDCKYQPLGEVVCSHSSQ